jgi:cytochrome c oxidase cbb3-type subunit IV
MYKETLRAIDGIGLFPVVSLLLFVTVFTVALVRVLRMDRGYAARLASLPLDGDGTACTAREVRR